MSPFLAWGDFHARSCFARSTIPEEKWGTTRSLRMDRLPNFLRYGAQLASASRAHGAPLSCNFCHFLKSAPTLLDDEFEDRFVHLYSVPCTD